MEIETYEGEIHKLQRLLGSEYKIRRTCAGDILIYHKMKRKIIGIEYTSKKYIGWTGPLGGKIITDDREFAQKCDELEMKVKLVIGVNIKPIWFANPYL